jgi:hypothetical protein
VLKKRTAHKARFQETIPHRGRYAPYEWWHRIEMLELNDVTHVSSKALRLRSGKPEPGCGYAMIMSVAEVLSVACSGAVRRVWKDSDRRAVAVAVAGWSSIAPVDFNCLGVNRTDIHWSSRRGGTKSCCLRREDLLITNVISKTMMLSKNKNLHRPLSSALNDSETVFRREYICAGRRLSVQAPSPGRQAQRR